MSTISLFFLGILLHQTLQRFLLSNLDFHISNLFILIFFLPYQCWHFVRCFFFSTDFYYFFLSFFLSFFLQWCFSPVSIRISCLFTNVHFKLPFSNALLLTIQLELSTLHFYCKLEWIPGIARVAGITLHIAIKYLFLLIISSNLDN